MCARAFVPLPRYAMLDVHLHDSRNPAGHVMSNSPYQLRAGHPLLRFSHLLLRRRGPCIVAQCRADAHGAGAQHSQGPHLATVRSPSLSRVHQPPGGLRSALVSLRARRCRLSSLLSDGTLPLPTPCLVLSCLLTLYTAVMSFEILFPFGAAYICHGPLGGPGPGGKQISKQHTHLSLIHISEPTRPY